MDRPTTRGGGSGEVPEAPEPRKRDAHPWDRRVPFPRRVVIAVHQLAQDDDYGASLAVAIGGTAVWTLVQIYLVALRLGW